MNRILVKSQKILNQKVLPLHLNTVKIVTYSFLSHSLARLLRKDRRKETQPKLIKKTIKMFV